jgi:hypothetical protein
MSVAYSGGRACGLFHGLAGAGQPAQAPEHIVDLHADGAEKALVIHTVGGVDVRNVCPLATSLLGRVVGICFPATRFHCGVPT